MHRQDRAPQRQRGPGEQQPLPQAHRPADLHRHAEPDIGALDRHHDREHHEPKLVRYRHRRAPPGVDGLTAPYALWRNYKPDPREAPAPPDGHPRLLRAKKDPGEATPGLNRHSERREEKTLRMNATDSQP